MNALFFWTGVAIWGAILWLFGVVLSRVLFTFCTTIDWFYWVYKCSKPGSGINWWKIPKTFLFNWYEFFIRENGSITFTSVFGYWRGFRDWEIYKTGDQTGGRNE